MLRKRVIDTLAEARPWLEQDNLRELELNLDKLLK